MEILEKMSQILNEAKSNRCGRILEKKPTEIEVCPICKGTGWETIDDGGQGTCVECRCGIRQKKIMGNRLKFADIPETFKNTKISNFDLSVYRTRESKERASIALKAIKYWLENLESMEQRGMGLYLYSSAKGSGKTRMAVSIANELIYDKKVQVKFSTSLQILNEIKSSWDRKNEYSESKLLDFLSTAKILIIDDFGTENDKSWINEKFYHIINGRYVDKKITIFTSNANLENLKYDDRITNRIKERTFQISFPEESVRDMIAKKNMSELIKGIRLEG